MIQSFWFTFFLLDNLTPITYLVFLWACNKPYKGFLRYFLSVLLVLLVFSVFPSRGVQQIMFDDAMSKAKLCHLDDKSLRKIEEIQQEITNRKHWLHGVVNVRD